MLIVAVVVVWLLAAGAVAEAASEEGWRPLIGVPLIILGPITFLGVMLGLIAAVPLTLIGEAICGIWAYIRRVREQSS